jgi:outer membrane protein assembly factor BamB
MNKLKGPLAVYPLLLSICILLGLTGCRTTPPAPVAPPAPTPAPTPEGTVTFLGRPTRDFYGSGPWKSNGPLKVVWQNKTGGIAGRFHKDPWGGTSWPGQPSVRGDKVYFGSADGNAYCFNRNTGELLWKFQTNDSLKATPVLSGNRVFANGIDDYIYCLDADTGQLIWKYKCDFEIDGSVAVIDGKVYFGSEDYRFYCLDYETGKLIYRTERMGSIEGSCNFQPEAGRAYCGTEQGGLFAFNLADGSVAWKAVIGHDSDTTPAVSEGFIYTAAEDGIVRCYTQDAGKLVWTYKTGGGIWASPVVVGDRVYIGSEDRHFYAFNKKDGTVAWKFQARGPVWSTAPFVEGRFVFGDKLGWFYQIDQNGQLVSDIKIGENVNSTPAVWGGKIYIGAFMGNLYCLENS